MAESYASIYNLLQQEPVTPFDPLTAARDVANLQDARSRSQIGKLALQAAQEERARQAQIREVYRRRYSGAATQIPGQAPMSTVGQLAPGPPGTPAPQGETFPPLAEQEAASTQKALYGTLPEGYNVNGPAAAPGPAGLAPSTPGQPPMAGAPVAGLSAVQQEQLQSELFQIDPAAGMAAETFAREGHIKKLEMLEKQNALVAQVTRAILLQDTQEAYNAGIATLRRYNIPVDDKPLKYDRRLVEHHHAMATDAKTRLEEQQLALQAQTETRLGKQYELDVTKEQRQARQFETTEERQQRQYELDVKKEDRAQTKAGREAAEAAMQVPQYTSDSTLNVAIHRIMQERGLTGPPSADVLKRAQEVVQEGKVQVSAAQGAEQVRLELENKPLEGEAAKAVSEITALQTMTDDVTDLFDKSYTGQWQGRWGAVKQWFGQAGKRQVVFSRIVQDMKDQLLRARSGAAITQSEYERLSGLVPNVTDATTTFQAKLLGFRRALDQAKAARLETATTARGPLRRQQEGVTPLPPREGKPTKRITRAQVQAKLKEGYTLEQAVEYYRSKGFEVTD